MQLGSLLVIAALSQKCRITPKVLKAILSTVASCAQQVSAKQFVRTLLCICAPQDTLEKFPRSLVTAIMRLPYVSEKDTSDAHILTLKVVLSIPNYGMCILG